MRYFRALIEINDFIKIERNQVFGLDESTNKIYYDVDKQLPNFILINLSNISYFEEVDLDTLFSIGTEVNYYDKLFVIKDISYFKMCYIMVDVSTKKEHSIPFEMSNLMKRIKY